MKKASAAKREAARHDVEQAVAAGPNPFEALTRTHIDQLRQVGWTRQEVTDIVRTLGGDRLARIVANDLDSYGDWAE